MVKHRPIIIIKCEKTFEILRSELTYLMDLYIVIYGANVITELLLKLIIFLSECMQ